MKVAIQGTLGSYHHQAAEKYFVNQEIELRQYDSFKKVTKSVHSSDVDFAVMAIENSIAGTLLPNYSLLTKYDLKIVGEVYLSIQHQLMALPGTLFSEIEEIRSHPMALLQCEKFLEKQQHLRVVESIDTALAAKYIQEKQVRNVAAVASISAAKLYNLEIIKKNIQTIKKNYTRFFILQKERLQPANFNKASLFFSTQHKSGSLAGILNELSYFTINMEKLQSVPIINKPWQYAFHIDITFDSIDNYNDLKTILKFKTQDLKILGEYTKNNAYSRLSEQADSQIVKI